jgi:hypothetical protein
MTASPLAAARAVAVAAAPYMFAGDARADLT